MSARGAKPLEAASKAPAPVRPSKRKGGASGLEPFRRRLDELDEQVARLLGERFAICREIALYKRVHDIPMMQPQRVVEVRERYLARGAEVELPSDFTAELFELLIDATCRMEDELIDAPLIIDVSSPTDEPPPTGARSPANAPSAGRSPSDAPSAARSPANAPSAARSPANAPSAARSPSDTPSAAPERSAP
jgi:chorismate mutase